LIGNFGLIGLSKAMIANESLEELYLYNNEIDDDAMEKFAEMLTNKKKFKYYHTLNDSTSLKTQFNQQSARQSTSC